MNKLKKILKYILKLSFALVLAPLIITSLNYLTNDSLIKMVSSIQNSSAYKSFFVYTNPCDENYTINKENKTVLVKDFNFSNNLGSCYVDKLNDVDLLEINLNFGGRTTSALVLADEVKKNDVNVKILEECYSSCVDVLMHGKERFVCENASVGIHQQFSKMEYNWLNTYLKKNNEASIDKYREYGIDVDMLLEIINKTPGDSMYTLSNKELLDSGVATKIIVCD